MAPSAPFDRGETDGGSNGAGGRASRIELISYACMERVPCGIQFQVLLQGCCLFSLTGIGHMTCRCGWIMAYNVKQVRLMRAVTWGLTTAMKCLLALLTRSGRCIAIDVSTTT